MSEEKQKITQGTINDIYGNKRKVTDVYLFRDFYIPKEYPLILDDYLKIEMPQVFLKKAIIGFEKKTLLTNKSGEDLSVISSPIFGWTSRITTPYMYYNGDYFPLEITDNKILEEHNVKEMIIDGHYYFKSDIKLYKKPNRRKPYNTFSRTFTKCKHGHSVAMEQFGITLQEYQKPEDLKIPKTFVLTNNLQYSFGVELEFAKGIIPEYVQHKINAFCERDGSLNPQLKTHPDSTGSTDNPGGGELVTHKLHGDDDMKHLQYICYELSKRCKIDKYCGVHAHVGNTPTDKAFIVRLYKLGILIQDEIFETLPISRITNDYCKKLPDLKFANYKIENKEDYEIINTINYEKIFCRLTENEVNYPGKGVNSRLNHPRGSKAGYNHNNIRYCWLNFLPLVFNTRISSWEQSQEKRRKNKNYKEPIKTKTIEFRCLNATLNFWKIYYYLLLYFAIVHYATNNEMNMSKLTINEILSYAYGRKSMNIIRFFDDRKELFSNENKETSEKTEYAKEKVVNPVGIGLKQLIKF